MHYDPKAQQEIWYQGMDESGRNAIWAPNRTTAADPADMLEGPVKKRLRRQRIIGLTIFLIVVALVVTYLIVQVLTQ